MVSDPRKRWIEVSSFTNRKVLVTGASRGLGRTIAKRLAAAGADVAINFRESEGLVQQVADDIRALGRTAEVIRADLSADEQVDGLVEEATRRLGRIDILIHNAGPGAYLPFLKLPPDRWHYVMNANCTALYLLAKAVAPQMRDRGWGRIVAIGAASAGIRSDSVYGLAKATMVHLVEALAVELAPQVTVNVISPGLMADNEDMSAEYAEATASETPMGRLVSRAEVAAAVVTLCGDEMGYVTGQNLVMDGGRTIPRFSPKT